MSVDFQQLQEDVTSIKGMLTLLTDRLNQPPGTVTPADEIFTIQQTAKFLDLTTASIYGMVYEGRIPFSKPNGRLYFLRSELVEWIKNGRKATADELDENARQQVATRLNRRNQSKQQKGGVSK